MIYPHVAQHGLFASVELRGVSPFVLRRGVDSFRMLFGLKSNCSPSVIILKATEPPPMSEIMMDLVNWIRTKSD